MRLSHTKRITILAMLSALAFLLAYIFYFLPIPAFVPSAPFLRYEPKDVVIVISGFLFGPLAVVPISLVVSLLEMPLSGTWVYGVIMNTSSSCVFSCTAALVYMKWRTLTGAGVGLAIGVVLTSAVMMPLNYFVTPVFMGVTRETVVGLLFPILLFNLIKYASIAAIALQLYKPLKLALTKSQLLQIPDDPSAKSSKVSIISLLVSAAVLVACVLVILYLHGVIKIP